MISVNRKGEVWVFAEQHEGKLEDIGLELLGRARALGDTLSVKVGAVLMPQRPQTRLLKCLVLNTKILIVQE